MNIDLLLGELTFYTTSGSDEAWKGFIGIGKNFNDIRNISNEVRKINFIGLICKKFGNIANQSIF